MSPSTDFVLSPEDLKDAIAEGVRRYLQASADQIPLTAILYDAAEAAFAAEARRRDQEGICH